MASRKRKPYKYRYKKPARRSAQTTEEKARSMQSSWRKATGRSETLPIADAKALIAAPPDCPYCLKPIAWQTFSVDHILPTSRAGESAPENLVWVCRECNITKGNLTGDEYKALLAFLKDWPVMKESILYRMRVAGAVFGRKRRWKR